MKLTDIRKKERSKICGMILLIKKFKSRQN